MKIVSIKFKRPRLMFVRRGDELSGQSSKGRLGNLIKLVISIALWIVIIIFAFKFYDKARPVIPKILKIPQSLIQQKDPQPTASPSASSASPSANIPSPTPSASPQISNPPSSDTPRTGQGIIRSCIVCANASPTPSPSPE